MPDASGVLALQSELSAYLPLSGGTMTGTIDFSGTDLIGLDFGFGGSTTTLRHDNGKSFVITSNGNRMVFGDNNITLYEQTAVTSDSMGISVSQGTLNYADFLGSYSVGLDLKTLPTAARTWQMPDADGTVALTSDIPTVAGVYLPLAGGTMTGNIILQGTALQDAGLVGTTLEFGGIGEVVTTAVATSKSWTQDAVNGTLQWFDGGTITAFLDMTLASTSRTPAIFRLE
jgi:hypothetical protein